MKAKFFRALDLVALTAIFACAVVVLVQLAAIPKGMEAGELISKDCAAFIGNKYEWGCARLGTITSNPLIAIGALLMTFVAALWLRKGPLFGISLWGVFKAQFVLYILLALAVRLIYFFLGSSTIEFVFWLIPPALLAIYFVIQVKGLGKERNFSVERERSLVRKREL